MVPPDRVKFFYVLDLRIRIRELTETHFCKILTIVMLAALKKNFGLSFLPLLKFLYLDISFKDFSAISI